MADPILETMLKDPEFRRKYVDEKARMDVAQLFADVMAERGWDQGKLAVGLGLSGGGYAIKILLSGSQSYDVGFVAQLLDELDMDLVITARKREAQNG